MTSAAGAARDRDICTRAWCSTTVSGRSEFFGQRDGRLHAGDATKSAMNPLFAGQPISLAMRCPTRRNTSLGNAVRRTRAVSKTSKEQTIGTAISARSMDFGAHLVQKLLEVLTIAALGKRLG